MTDQDDATDGAPVVVGSRENFWLWTAKSGWDLTRPPVPQPTALAQHRLRLDCEISNITIDPLKSALVAIDMQNFSMSAALGVDMVPAVLDAQKALLEHGIPAARKANIQVIWLNWGLTEEEVDNMPPQVARVFGHKANCQADDYGLFSHPCEPCQSAGLCHRGEIPRRRGPGADLGRVLLPDKTKVDAGRALMRGSWNTELHGPLLAAFHDGQSAARPDVLIHKNRNSGLYDSSCDLAVYLKDAGIRTLLFAGMNTDQCVMSTLQDAQCRGFDAVMLRDACATSSPEFAQKSAEYNCCRALGFLSSCKALASAARIYDAEGL